MQYVATYPQSDSLFKAILQHVTAKRLVVLFLIVTILLGVSYVYLINATIRNVVAYGQLQKTNSALSLRVDSLQSNYISLKSAITMNSAYTDGYQDVNTPQFIAAPSAAAVALNDARP